MKHHIRIRLLIKVGIIVFFVLVFPRVILHFVDGLSFLYDAGSILFFPGLALGALFFPSDVFGRGHGTELTYLIGLVFSWVFYVLIVYLITVKVQSRHNNLI